MNLDRFLHGTLGLPYRLHYRVHGRGDKPVIIMLHGIAASSDDWSKLIPLLTSQYRCVTIDLLGFAKSPKPQWARYDMRDHLYSIDYTINHLRGALRLRGSFILAGHSLGSLLATKYVSEHPTAVERLLLLSPPVYPHFDFGDKASQRRTNLLMKLYKFLRTNPRMTPTNLSRLSRILPLPRSVVIHKDTWIPFFRTLDHCIEQQTIIQDIKRVTLPVDVFYGSLDSVVVGSNVRRLASDNVRFHTFRGNHTIGQRYAKTVAATLIDRPSVRPTRRRLAKRRIVSPSTHRSG